MTSDEIRSRFLDFFARNGHRVVRSSSLIPQRDPTLLFANAGMNQFKDVFLGREKRDYSRAATAQKCVRAGGKHNDLENVGYTNRHLTFFEMLGNFSFGDYFKADAIRFAWSFLTGSLGLPEARLYATVYQEDDEAHGLWRREIGLPDERVVRLGMADNFWAMGDTGPCGPCSELHIDTGQPGCGRPGCGPGCDCGRFVELWNLVFMQFDRDAAGTLTALPAPSIDTGMGLERISMVLQGVDSVFATDLLQPIMERTAEMAGLSRDPSGPGPADRSVEVALRVIADHLRSSSFLLADGALPANDGRGYVLRRIIRRALRFGKRLGFEQPFLHELSGFVATRMGAAYPELLEAREHIATVVKAEEERFAQALAYSGRAFDELATGLEARGDRVIPGAEAFRLYDTFGLPLDTLKDMAEVRGLQVDETGFAGRMEEVRKAARETWKGGADRATSPVYQTLVEGGAVRFVGYDRLELGEALVRAVLRDHREAAVLETGERGDVVLDATPFYPEGGGQVGDRGTLVSADFHLQVEDTQQPMPGLILHRVLVRQGRVRPGDRVDARVELSRRRPTALNHSATHLLHAALRSVLGEHVKQAGSLVAPDRLRFDFTHYGKIDPADLRRIERLVNDRVSGDDPVEAEVLPIEQALARGAMAFFGDKYGDRVRVIRMGDFSLELCGGTHVAATGNIGYFALTSEGSVSSGVRRVEAVTGEAAVLRALEERGVLEELAGRMHVPVTALVEHVEELRRELKAARREVTDLRLKLAAGSPASPGDEFRTVGPARLAVRRVEGLDPGAMRNLADELRKKVGSGVVVLGTVREAKASLLVSVTADLAEKVNAGTVARELAPVLGGSGGGKADMAQAGGPLVDQLDQALEQAASVVSRRLGLA